MFIRCAKCHGSVWLDLARGSLDALLTCEGCGQAYKPQRWSSDAAEEFRQNAHIFAIENGIDMPGAFSVLLGLMTLGQVLDVGAAPAPPSAPRSASMPEDVGDTTGSPAVKIDYDPAFLPAVEAGSLTARQALERGDRESFAQRLIDRHKMSEELAYLVADNRMSLLAAIRSQEGREELRASTIDVRMGTAIPTAQLRRALAWMLFVAVILGAGAGWLYLGQDRDAPLDNVTVQTDNKGRIVQVEGPDPRSVLEAYCAARRTREPLVPLGVMPATMGNLRVRVGVLRDPLNKDRLLAISIRRDRDASRWFAGDGRAELHALRAPDAATDAFTGLAEAPKDTP